MVIECNEISQVINELQIAFQDCNKIKNSDLRKLVDLVSAVNTCSNGGPSYNTLITDVYEPLTDTIITYPINSFHSITLMLIQGNILYNGVTLPKGSVINIEFTTLNQTPFIFTALSSSKVMIEYQIETI
jgi:hypothetical protein